MSAYSVYRLEDAQRAIERSIAGWIKRSATGPRSVAVRRCSRGSTGTWATATPPGRRRSRRSRFSSRSASRWRSRGLQRPRPVEEPRVQRSGDRLGRTGARASLPGSGTNEPRRTCWSIWAASGWTSTPADLRAARRSRVRGRGRRQARGSARPRQPRLCADVVGAAEYCDSLRETGARLRGTERGAQPRHRGWLPRGCNCWSGAWDEAEQTTRAEIEKSSSVAQLARPS